jgi:phenylacetate-CoA ligase
MWNQQAECLARHDLVELQLARLRDLLSYLSDHVPFYRRALERAQAAPASIRTLDDVARLPFTTKSDLRDHYPFDLFAAPLDAIVRIHASSGTTGKPTVVGYTRADMEVWAELMARTLSAAGVTSADVVHNAYGYGLFTGGLGIGLGAETIGAAVVPASSGFTKRHLMLMEDFGATVLGCTPSYGLVLADVARELDIDVHARLKLRVGLMGAEPSSEALRAKVESQLGLEVFDIYGLSEIIGPGVAVECAEHDGLHLFEDHFLAEVIDPETGERLPDGCDGELVLTTLTKTGIPLLRYRTRDRTRLATEPCACGRRLARMTKVHGRTDDMLIVRGVNVFPSQIEEALVKLEGLAPHYVILVDRRADRLDGLDIQVEAMAEVYGRGATAVDDLRRLAQTELHQSLGLRAGVEVVAPGKLDRREGKAVRVKDRRTEAMAATAQGVPK